MGKKPVQQPVGMVGGSVDVSILIWTKYTTKSRLIHPLEWHGIIGRAGINGSR